MAKQGFKECKIQNAWQSMWLINVLWITPVYLNPVPSGPQHYSFWMSPLSAPSISGLRDSTNGLMSWFKCIWLVRNQNVCSVGVPPGTGLENIGLPNESKWSHQFKSGVPTPANSSTTPNQAHLNQLIKGFKGYLINSGKSIGAKVELKYRT